MQMAIFLQIAPNGDRIPPPAPPNPTAVIEAASTAAGEGPGSVHVHTFDAADRGAPNGCSCARVLRAIRALCNEDSICLASSVANVRKPRERFNVN